jgi:hypothetical protein
MISIKKFKCKVEKVYTYEIEIDEDVWTEKVLEDWSSVFEDVYDLAGLVYILAERKTRYEVGEFIEGFGTPMIDGKNPYNFIDDKTNKSININIIDEDDVCVECEEID